MTYDDIFAARDRLLIEGIRNRATHRAEAYRDLRMLLWLSKSYPKSTIIDKANKLRMNPRGLNLKRLRYVMEAITGENLCW